MIELLDIRLEERTFNPSPERAFTNDTIVNEDGKLPASFPILSLGSGWLQMKCNELIYEIIKNSIIGAQVL